MMAKVASGIKCPSKFCCPQPAFEMTSPIRFLCLFAVPQGKPSEKRHLDHYDDGGDDDDDDDDDDVNSSR